jgi:hypothetical protein
VVKVITVYNRLQICKIGTKYAEFACIQDYCAIRYNCKKIKTIAIQIE